MTIGGSVAIAVRLGAIVLAMVPEAAIAGPWSPTIAAGASAAPTDRIAARSRGRARRDWDSGDRWGGWLPGPSVGGFGSGIYCRYYHCPAYPPPTIPDAYRRYRDGSW